MYVMTLRLTTDNDAFAVSRGAELARILRRLAEVVEYGIGSDAGGTLRDFNGNTVGRWSYSAGE